MKKLNFKFKIKIKSRAAIIFAGLFILGIAYYIISREVLFPKLSYSIFDNSYYYNGSDFNIKVKKEEDQIASKFESRGASINTKLLGYTVERYGDKNTLFQGRKMDAQAFYSLSNGVAYIEYRAEKNGMKEFIYLKNSASPRWYDFELNLENISDYKQINGEWIFFNKNGTQVFKIPKGYMVDAKGVYSDDVEILITDRENKKIVSVRPNLEWLNDVNRAYPVAVDPSVVVSGGQTSSSFQFGGIQRKVAYSEDSSAWYVFYTSSGNIVYKKSSDGSTWGSPVTVASGNKANPSVWMHTDGKIYVTWLDTSANTISANTVDTASSDTLGTACVSSSLGTISDTFTASISVATDDTVYLAYSDTSTDTEAGVYKLTYSGCSFSDITSGSGLTSGDRPVLDAVGTNLHMVYQDGQLSHSVYNGSSWTSSDTQIANVTDNVYSTVSDGSNVWVLSKSGTTGTNFYFYDGTWSTETAPWSGETNVVSVTLSYASDEKALFATIIKDATEQAYWSMQLVDPAPNQVSGWVAGGSYDFTPGNLSELTSVYSTIIAPNIAIALLQESNIEFAFQDEDTLSNYQTIETRLGENTDVFDPPSTENTVFGRLAYISETQSGTSSDDGSDPTLFGRVGSPTDIQQCTETGCANETIFGILKNLPGRSRNMLSQFGGYGTESTSGVCGATGAIYISAGIHQYAGNCTVGDGSTPTAIHPADGTIRGGLFLFFTGNLTITNNAKIDVSGYGAPGGNGGNTNFNGFGGWGGGPDGGNGAAGNVSGTRNGGDAGPNSISGAGGGGGGDFCDGFGTGGAGGGGAGANGGNGSKKTGTSCASCDTVCNGFNNAEETLAAKRDSILTTAKYGVLSSYGAGGGGGAGIATTVVGGGGGGGGGGLIWIRTRNLINNGTLNINGGAAGLRGATSGSIGSGVNGEGGNGALNGSAAGKSSGSDGGGGGGGGAGGGVIYIEANAITINSGGGLHARGGNGGNGGNTPGSPTAASYNGKNGANGFVFIEIVP